MYTAVKAKAANMVERHVFYLMFYSLKSVVTTTKSNRVCIFWAIYVTLPARLMMVLEMGQKRKAIWGEFD